jgi:hypothetical protein
MINGLPRWETRGYLANIAPSKPESAEDETVSKFSQPGRRSRIGRRSPSVKVRIHT